MLSLSETSEVETVTAQLTAILRDAHDLDSDEENDFTIETPEQMMETFETIIAVVTIVVGGIVGISLLVGGIGIMNIMLVSVTERTREIGILGYGLGTLIADNIPSFPPAAIPTWAVALALGFSGFVGILFGILPAAKAANLDPIDALR